MKRKAQGNPLAAGVIAFGLGMLVSSLIPSSEKERQAVSQLQENLEPVKEKASEVARDVGESLKPAAQEAAESVKTAAQEGAETVKQEGQAAAQDVKTRLRTPRRRCSSRGAELLRDSGGFTSLEVDPPLLYRVPVFRTPAVGNSVSSRSPGTETPRRSPACSGVGPLGQHSWLLPASVQDASATPQVVAREQLLSSLRQSSRAAPCGGRTNFQRDRTSEIENSV